MCSSGLFARTEINRSTQKSRIQMQFFFSWRSEQKCRAFHATRNIFTSEQGVRFENTLANKELAQRGSAPIKEEM